MATPYPHDNDPETTPERPSSFREKLYRDRPLLSRRQMDRRIRDTVAGRNEQSATEKSRPSAFPALARLGLGSRGGEVRVVVTVIILVLGAFFFGHWVG